MNDLTWSNLNVIELSCDFEGPLFVRMPLCMFASGLCQWFSSGVGSEQMPAPPGCDQHFSGLLPALPRPKGTN